MPIAYTLEQDGTFVLANATGVLTVDCFLAMQGQMKADPQLRTPHSTLLDVRHASDIRIAEDDLDKIVRSLSAGPRTLGAERLAIVATQELAFRLGAIYGEREKEVKEDVIVFYQMDVARLWLGLA